MEIKPRYIYATWAVLHPTIYLLTRGKEDLFIYLNLVLGIFMVLAFFFMFIVRTKRRKETDYISLLGIIISLFLLVATFYWRR